MAEIGNGIHIGHGANGMTISASGTIVGTLELDTISVESTTQSTDALTFEVILGEDSIADELSFAEGAGKDFVVVRNFVSGTDKIEYTGNSSNLSQQTLNVTAAASLIGDALGLSSDPNVSDVSFRVGNGSTGIRCLGL